MPPRQQSHLLWLDFETTGSGGPGTVEDDKIIEVGCVLTTIDLKEVASYSAVVEPAHWMKLLERDEKVMAMHVANGLVGDLLAGKGIPASKAEMDIIDILSMHNIAKGRLVRLAGGGVCHFDRKFIRAEMPRLDLALDHKSHDVGDLRRVFSDIAGRSDLLMDYDPKTKAHRALPDAYEHLAECRHYQSLIRSIGALP
jgi:oligoribonuclease (3'-5' exoribonuclease)